MRVLVGSIGFTGLCTILDPLTDRSTYPTYPKQVGLGSLGVVSELTLQCIPQHQLLEKTYVVEDLNQVHVYRWAVTNIDVRADFSSHHIHIRTYQTTTTSFAGSTTTCCGPTATCATCGCPSLRPWWWSSPTRTRRGRRRCPRESIGFWVIAFLSAPVMA